MPRKAFQLQVEIEIQAISCPGVWLCPSGKVSLQLYMLDSCIQAKSFYPVFPILCHEKFVFYKTFYQAQKLTDLEKLLRKEILYAELIQWQNCDIGNVLASFETTLAELLYPTIKEGVIAGVDVDLLMEPEKHFPGIIAPKVEVSTKTTIEEKHYRDEGKASNAFLVNPKVIRSTTPEKTPVHFRQRKVCHSAGYHWKTHKKKRCERPPFIVRKVEDDILARKPKGLDHDSDPCKCMSRSKSLSRLFEKNMENETDSSQYEKQSLVYKKPLITSGKIRCSTREKTVTPVCHCTCGHRHTQQSCPVCSKYQHYFDQSNRQSPDQGPTVTVKDKLLKMCPKAKNICCCCDQNDDQKRCDDLQTYHWKGKDVCKAMDDFKGKDLQETLAEVGVPRPCDCPGHANCKKLCFCPPKRKTTLAERLHERLNRTLGSCIACPYPEMERNQDLSTIYEQNCPPSVECQCGNCSSSEIFKNFDKFYKGLYRNESNCKSGASSNRYMTSCY